MSQPVVGVIGLGYVGLPVAVAFAEKFKVIGFDISKRRIEELTKGIDRTEEITTAQLKSAKIEYTDQISNLKAANFFVVAVPTPVDNAQRPDMSLVHSASRSVGKALKVGDIVVYESTVYPGATEDECVPILEQESGLKFGRDFQVGFSPERINPGDHKHTFKTIKKVVSGSDEKSLRIIAETYGTVVDAGIYQASSIKVAEASKVIENSQRDLNVAFMNELSKIFHLMNIDTLEVLKAASTKWNFLNFYPGLVGGHCIGVDPYYLTFKAQQYGYQAEVILAGRRINDGMGFYAADAAIEMMIQEKVDLTKGRINILGLTFKEDCPDVRNSRVVDIYRRFKNLKLEVHLSDARASHDDIEEDFHAIPEKLEQLEPAHCLVLAVPHEQYRKMEAKKLLSLMKSPKILIDLRGARPDLKTQVDRYWSL